MLEDHMVPLSLRRMANLATKPPRHYRGVIEPYATAPRERRESR
jgi:hypothetical protein